MKKYSFLKKKLYFTFIIFLLQISLFAASKGKSQNWTLAAEKFTYTKPKTDAVSDSIAALIPSRILDNMSGSLYRTVFFDEQYERDTITLKTERNSLFLQLSGEVKKRDSLVLGNYSDKELKNKLKTADEKIQEIKDKIDENLKKQKELNDKLKEYNSSEKVIQEKKHPQSEKEKYANFLKNIIYEDEAEALTEQIVLYKDNSSSLYTPSEAAKTEGYVSQQFNKEVQAQKINGLIAGQITNYNEYLFVSVSLYIYPGAQYVTTVSEVGTKDEIDFISESLARQLLPSLTNALPVSVTIKVQPEEALSSLKIYLDSSEINQTEYAMILDSGVHFFQFIAKDYKTAATTYYFEGNKNYLIEVNLESAIKGEIYLEKDNSVAETTFVTKMLDLFKPDFVPANGEFYVNGLLSERLTEEKSKIVINGNNILGEFIAENGEGVFFYIPENQLKDKTLFSVKGNAFNRDEYIENHRRQMYNAYSGLMVSLIPMFITKGLKENNNKPLWKIANGVTVGASVGCGLWFVYELVRYFMAADSVLPEMAKTVEYDYSFTLEEMIQIENKDFHYEIEDTNKDTIDNTNTEKEE